MATVRQLTANRQNAKHSTGPKTPAGKARISHNAISHGIFAQRLLLEGEQPEEYQRLLDGLIASLKAEG